MGSGYGPRAFWRPLSDSTLRVFSRFVFYNFDRGCLAGGCMGSTRRGKVLEPLLFLCILMIRRWKRLSLPHKTSRSICDMMTISYKELESSTRGKAAGVKRLLFCGVGCQVQALRSVEQHLNLDKLYVLGTNCVDNGTREGLDKFLNAASSEPETVLHYEFMQDYKVHLKHLDGHIEEVPYFCLPANELVDVIAPSCYSCFDYTNALAEKYCNVLLLREVTWYAYITSGLGGGIHGCAKIPWSKHDTTSTICDSQIGPKGLEFARYSLDYHTIRNYIYVNRMWGKQSGVCKTRVQGHSPTQVNGTRLNARNLLQQEGMGSEEVGRNIGGGHPMFLCILVTAMFKYISTWYSLLPIGMSLRGACNTKA
uniref:Coenzyme F420 hydrogenase/dehydrogenase beta subunit C-terminal domain-containing protein n=1 Tax=Vitis vinifera TaxID=29760 RepID=A5BYY8_VITVI|nr:hypothetical protein VITISV_038426 [Vitis vinifera]